LFLFAAGVVYTGGNLPPASLTPVANLPPISTKLAKMVDKFAAGVVDTSGKFAPVWLIPVVHLPCEYLRKFSKKFEMV
jgi:hypothetical protein